MGIMDAGSRGPFDAVRFSTSWLVPPSVLFAMRTLISLFIFITIFVLLGLDTSEGAQRSFSYFTVLTFWGLGFYFAFAALHTGSYWLKGQPLLAKWPKALQIMHSIFYTTITTFPFIVTVVYWALIYNDIQGSFRIFSNTAQHVLNTAFALFEIFIPRTNPTPWFHLVPLTILLLLYLGLAYVTWGTQHFYVYDFLDDRIHPAGIIAGCIVGVFIGNIIVFTIVHFFMLGRVKLTEEKFKKTGRLDTRRPKASDERDFELMDASTKK